MQSTLKIGNQKIVVTHPEGTELKMEDGRLSAQVPSHRSIEAQLNEEMSKHGVQWGDAIAWATSSLGIQPCPACKKRIHILNRAKQLGIVETVRQIKETFRGSK